MRIETVRTETERTEAARPEPRRSEPPGSEFSFLIGAGRGRAVDFEIDHPEISRTHAVIHSTDAGFFIEDPGSHNGTWVDGERVPVGIRQALHPECAIRFGAVEAVFVVEPEEGERQEALRKQCEALASLTQQGLLQSKRQQQLTHDCQARGGRTSPIEQLLREGIDARTWASAYRGELAEHPSSWSWVAVAITLVGLIAALAFL